MPRAAWTLWDLGSHGVTYPSYLKKLHFHAKKMEIIIPYVVDCVKEAISQGFVNL